MSKHQIHVFISHSWSYSKHYNTLAEWIFEEKWHVRQDPLDFCDYSVPKDDPIHNPKNSNQLQKAIYDKIRRSHVIVIPTGMYASYSHWIKKEILGSKQYNKPILAINPWSQEKKSSVVVKNAQKLVGWNKKSVVQGIWDLYDND